MLRSRLEFCIVCLLVLPGRTASASPTDAGSPASPTAAGSPTVPGSPTAGGSPAAATPNDRESPQGVIRSLQAAWIAGDAREVVRHFVDGKVPVALGHGPAGWFSRDQSYYLLGELFAATQTHEFRFLGLRDPAVEQGAAAALAHWRHRSRGGGQVDEDVVLVALVRQAELWSVSMIQVLR